MGARQTIRKFIRRCGYDIVRLKHADYRGVPECFPPGHHYSVVPSLAEASGGASAGFCETVSLHGIELCLDAQLKVLEDFRALTGNPPFYAKAKRIRFDIENDSFSYDDAPILHYMMRRLRPRDVIEIGCGNSSACMLDTSEIYLDGTVDFTFIDPHCDNLKRFLLEKDFEKIQILERPVQNVNLSIFTRLQANDILFIDSSHVIKVGSDLQTIFFQVLPILAPGVWIHFHDVRFPFRYSADYALKGIFWNEAYLLRAFLMYNTDFKVGFWLNGLMNSGLPGIGGALDFLPLPDWDRRFSNGCGDYSEAGGSIYLVKRK